MLYTDARVRVEWCNMCVSRQAMSVAVAAGTGGGVGAGGEHEDDGRQVVGLGVQRRQVGRLRLHEAPAQTHHHEVLQQHNITN